MDEKADVNQILFEPTPVLWRPPPPGDRTSPSLKMSKGPQFFAAREILSQASKVVSFSFHDIWKYLLKQIYLFSSLVSATCLVKSNQFTSDASSNAALPCLHCQNVSTDNLRSVLSLF